MKLIIAALLAGTAIAAAPAADAQIIECQITGVLIVITAGPTTICAFDTNDPQTFSVAPSVQLPIHLGETAP
jgi:hypothetical protein